MSNLGERISVSDDLPYPGSTLIEDLFSGAEDMSSPYAATTHTADTVVPPKPAAKPSTVPTKKKPTLQLQKFREAFGVKSIEKVAHTLTSETIDGDALAVTFHFRALGYEDFQWALEKAKTLTDLPLVVAWNMTSLAVSICAMDINYSSDALPTPIYLVFDVTQEIVRDPYLPQTSVRFAAADALLEELRGSFFNLIEELRDALEKKIGSKYRLLTEEKVENPLV